VACIASSTRAFFFFNSVSVAAPTDDRHTTDQLGEPLLQPVAVVLGGRILDLLPKLVHTTCNRRGGAAAIDECRGVPVNRDFLCFTEVFDLHALEFHTEVLGHGHAAR
jgi:hypothetical protein